MLSLPGSLPVCVPVCLALSGLQTAVLQAGAGLVLGAAAAAAALLGALLQQIFLCVSPPGSSRFL